MTYHNTSALKKEHGAALMVAMVLMFMLTVLGLSTMRDSTLEGKLAANAVQKEVTFQAAESATDTILAIENAADPLAIESVICMEDPMVHPMPNLSQAGVQTTEASIEYGGQAVPEGYSLGGPIGSRRFVVTAETTLLGANTSSRISQGIVLVGAIEAGSVC